MRSRFLILGAAGAAGAAAAGVVLATWLASAQGRGPMGERSRPASLAWVIGASTLKRLAHLDRPLALRLFDSRRTLLIAGRRSRPSALAPRAVPTMSFANELALRRAILAHRLLPGTRAVIYDDEDWALTPRDQQLHPARYYRMAAAVAHAHGLALIATPASDLVRALAPRTPADQRYAEFLRLGLAAAAARYADVFEIQAQGSEADLSRYASFVRAAAAQARAGHPAVEVLAGISTNPSGRAQGASVLLYAVLATRSTVAGYWLNDPAAGSACPRCTGPYPGVALAFLQALQARSGDR